MHLRPGVQGPCPLRFSCSYKAANSRCYRGATFAASIGTVCRSLSRCFFNNSAGAGAIGITGWALAIPAVTTVSIWREATLGSKTLVFVDEATIIAGVRPDVAKAYPGYPNNNFGWGLQVLTNELPNSNGKPGLGNGTYRFHVLVLNGGTQPTDIGTVTMTVDNADSVLPFGTIDTPGPGDAGGAPRIGLSS